MTDLKASPDHGLLLIVNYNQVHEITSFLEHVTTNFSKEHSIVVDDGSTDGSREIAEKMGFKVIRHPKNLGVGAAIRTGIQYGTKKGYRWVLISAANGKMRPDEFARVYGPVDRDETDYVQGSRFVNDVTSPGLPLFRRMMIPLFSIITSILMGRRFSDITCGLRCYKLALTQDPSINLNQDWLNQYELEYYLHFKVARSKRYRMIEVPVTMQYSQLARGRHSKIQPFTGWWSMIRPFVLLAFRIKK
jgi:dolichol-phosphate mannosyltransferase